MQTPKKPKIEQRLEDYARQRRQAMGEPLEMSAATEKILLTEAHKHWKPDEDEPIGWRSLWIRLAWTCAVAAVAVFILTPLVFQSTNRVDLYAKQETRVRTEVRKPELSPAPIPAVAPESSEKKVRISKLAEVSPAKDRDQRLARRSVALKVTNGLDLLPPMTTSAESQKPATTRAAASSTIVASKNAPVVPQEIGRGVEGAKIKAKQDKAVGAAPASPTINGQERMKEALAYGVNLVNNQWSYLAVLNAFELRQDGSSIEIRDEDGSLYSGQVLPSMMTNVMIAGKLSSSANRSIESKSPAKTSLGIATGTAFSNRKPIVQNIHFKASGTNRSLQQPVEIEGELATVLFATNFGEPMNTNALAAFAGDASNVTPLYKEQETRTQLNQSLYFFQNSPAFDNKQLFSNTAAFYTQPTSQLGGRFDISGNQNSATYLRLNDNSLAISRNARVLGQATIGGTNQIRIDAIPAAK